MERPKREQGDMMNGDFLRGQTLGFNIACDKWEAYHNHILNKLADEEWMNKTISDGLCSFAGISLCKTHGLDLVDFSDLISNDLSKRIKEEIK